MTHTVTLDELETWLAESENAWIQFAFSGGDGSHKSLEVNHAGKYKVTDHGEIIYSGGSAKEAVAKYNEAP